MEYLMFSTDAGVFLVSENEYKNTKFSVDFGQITFLSEARRNVLCAKKGNLYGMIVSKGILCYLESEFVIQE